MKQMIIRIAKPIGYAAVAVLAAGAFLAASPEGWSTVKSALAGQSEGATCKMEGKEAKGGSCSKKDAKTAAAKDGATCSKSEKTAQAAASSKGGCCAEGKDAAAKSAATCPMSGKTEGAVTPAVNKSGDTCAMKKTADAGACSKEAGACAAKTASDACCEGKDILSVAKAHEDFSTLMLAAEKAGVTESLSCKEPKTVFAPTNDAFKKIPAEQWTALLENKEQLRAILARHIVPGVMKSDDLKKQTSAKLGDGQELPVSTCSQSGTVSLGNAKVVRSEVASNGVVYAIDSVLMPEAKTAAAPAAADAVKVATK